MTAEELEAEILLLSESGELDKILRMLRSHYPQLPRDVAQEVLQQALTEVIDRQLKGGDITNLGGLVWRIAKREMGHRDDKVNAEAVSRDPYNIDNVDDEEHNRFGWRDHSEQRQEHIERAMAYIKQAVEAWPDNNHRRTLLLIFEAAADGIQLEPRDLDAQLGCARGTGRVWRARALDRLRVQMENDGISWENFAELMPDFDQADDAKDFDTEEES